MWDLRWWSRIWRRRGRGRSWPPGTTGATWWWSWLKWFYQILKHSLVIVIGDVNDNSPQFSKPSYQASIPENTQKVIIINIHIIGLKFCDLSRIDAPIWPSKTTTQTPLPKTLPELLCPQPPLPLQQQNAPPGFPPPNNYLQISSSLELVLRTSNCHHQYQHKHNIDQDSAVVRVVATDADRNRTISYSIEGFRNITKLVGIDKARYLVHLVVVIFMRTSWLSKFPPQQWIRGNFSPQRSDCCCWKSGSRASSLAQLHRQVVHSFSAYFISVVAVWQS